MLCPPQLTLSYVRQLSYHHLWMFVTSMFTGGLTLYQFVAVSKDSSARTPFGNLARQAGLQQLGQHRPWRLWIMLWSWEYDENIHGKHHGFFLSLSPIHIEHHPETKNHGGCANTLYPMYGIFTNIYPKINPNDPICRQIYHTWSIWE